MPGRAIGIKLNLGYPGSVTRSGGGDPVIASRVSAGEIPFGAPVYLNADNSVVLFGAGSTAARFMGFAVRIVKQPQSVFETVGGYRDGELSDVLTRGAVCVAFNGVGTPTAGGSVYVRTALNSTFPNSQIGDVEAAADGTNTVLLTNATFTTGEVVDGVVEVTVNERRV